MTAPNPAHPYLPPFAEAVATLCAFLVGQGAPAQVIWVSRGEVTSHRRRIWVRLGDPDEALRRAEAMYEDGRRRGLGVSMRAVCRVGSSTACYVWAPKDELSASYAMQPRSLKCLVPAPLLPAIEVTSAVGWHLLRLVNRRRRFGDAYVNQVPAADVAGV
jgi:hypothetical protein